MRIQQSHLWTRIFFLFFFISFARSQAPDAPVSPPTARLNPITPPVAPIALNCSLYSSCWPCTSTGECVWCLASSTCSTPDACSFTAYTDCCPTLGACDSCKDDARCGFCSDESVTGCMSGNSSSSADGSCPSGHWNYDTCPTTGDTPGGVILGIVLTIGGFLAILSIVLLVILLRRLFIQRRAQQAIARHYRRRLQKQTCQLCRDGIAVSRCIPCNIRLCQHCVQLQAHQDHHLEPLDFAVVVNEGSADLPTTPREIEKKSLINSEDNYTTFAAIISQGAGSAPRSGTINSFGTFGSANWSNATTSDT